VVIYNESGELADLSGYGNMQKTGSLIPKPLPKDGNRVWKVKTPPAIEPVTVAELKLFARIDGTDEDTLLEGFIQGCREATESYMGRALIQQTYRMVMDWWPGRAVELPRPPLISVELVATIDEDDDETTYSSDNYYEVTEGVPGKIVLKQGVTAPQNTDRNYGGYLIEWKAGYGDVATDVPKAIRDGITVWATVVYETRTLGKEPPMQARALLDLFRVLRF
jgi:uncharacterized phiE125 gp8 family phage protein